MVSIKISVAYLVKKTQGYNIVKMVWLCVLAQYQRVTDKQTDRRTDGIVNVVDVKQPTDLYTSLGLVLLSRLKWRQN